MDQSVPAPLKCQCEFCDLRDLFFSHVEPAEMDNICNEREEVTYAPGDFIVRENDPVISFMYLKEGLVKLYKTNQDQKDQIISIGKQLDFVSLISVFTEERYLYSMVALKPSVTCNLDFEFVVSMARKNGSFALDLMKKLSKASDEVILQSLEIRRRHLKGRVAYVILMFSEKIFRSNQFELPISRKEMADFIGMTTENVIRSLSEFRKDKILQLYGKHINIIDPQRLKTISDFG